MNKTFEESWTVEVVERIFSEFNNSSGIFLCSGSETFRNIWKIYKYELRDLSCEFNQKEKELKDWSDRNGACLFYCDEKLGVRQTRLMFLRSEIERLRKL